MVRQDALDKDSCSFENRHKQPEKTAECNTNNRVYKRSSINETSSRRPCPRHLVHKI